ncbi:MAG: hypothetical protein AB7K68_16250 [Bacteriovoracia bacterium]
MIRSLALMFISLSFCGPALAAGVRTFNTAGVCLSTPEVPRDPVDAKALLSCVLPNPQKLPKIIIAGEIHAYAIAAPSIAGQAYVKSAKNSEDYFKKVLSRALKSEVLFASEGFSATLDAKPFQIKTFKDLDAAGYGRLPLEGELELALGGMIHFSTFNLYQSMSKDDPDYGIYLDGRVDNLLLTFARNNYLQMAFKKIPRPYKEDSREFIAQLFDKLECFEDPRVLIEYLRKNLYPQWGPELQPRIRQAFIDVFGDIYQNLAAIAEQRLTDKELGQQMHGLISGKGFEKDSNKFQDQFMPLVNQVRNERMSDNLEMLYCALAQKSKDIYVQVGAVHALPLAAKMRELFTQRGLDPKLVEVVDTTQAP